jgi:hypothetical protein
MSVLALPRSDLVGTAIRLSRQWCAGRIIDGAPAIGHALKVANKLSDHLPSAPDALIAAVILHDAPSFAPADVDLDAVLGGLGPSVLRIVRAIEREHVVLDGAGSPEVDTKDRAALIASAADKVVSIAAITRRGRRAPDERLYWDRRQAFVARVPYFQAFAAAAEPHLPVSLARELQRIVDIATDVTSAYRGPIDQRG